MAQARGVAPSMQQLGPTLDSLFDQVGNYLSQQGASPVGPGITLYLDQDVPEQDVRVATCIAFEGTLSDGAQIKVVELPGMEAMASVIHHGSFSTLNLAYHAAFTWIEANGYQNNGPIRELNLEYTRGGDQSRFVTEIQFPVQKS